MKYKLIDDYQYGFLEKSCTQSAVTDALHKICSELDKGKFIITVFVDLQKAFDVVNHEILIEKLYKLGIRSQLLNLIKTYLANRRQYVCYDNVNSTTLLSNCGVPQGSALGPLLYILYVLSLKNAHLRAQYYMYADDTILVYDNSNLKDLQNEVNSDLQKYMSWLQQNKLKINSKKTTYMLFKQKNSRVIPVEIKMNNEVLQRVSYTNYLGLNIDDKLNWQEHYQKIVKKMLPMIGAIYRSRDYLNVTSKYKIYNGFFLSVFRYLITIWGACSTSLFKKYQILQNKILKILFKLNCRTPTVDIYRNLKLQSLDTLFNFEQCKHIYRIQNQRQKNNTTITYCNQIHSYKTRQREQIYTDYSRTNRGLNNPIIRSIKTYNSLPQHIQHANGYNQFIKFITTHYAN